MIDYEHRPEHWRLTSRFGLIIVATALLLVLLGTLFSGLLNQVFFLRLPIGFYFASQGLVIVCIALVFWFANRQERTDRRYGATED